MSIAPTLTHQLVDAVDHGADALVEATTRAVRIPSITPNFPGEDPADHLGRETEVSGLVAELLADVGLEIDRFAIADGRENCVGVLRGRGGGRSLILNGHVDVVPAQPAAEWTGGDAFSGRVADGRIWGRGACDMKAGLMAAVFAVRALAEARVRPLGDVIVQAVVGEEMMEHELGTSAVLARGYTADAAVVAEPSPPRVPLAVSPVTAGLLWCAISVAGRATHAGMRSETMRPGGVGAAGGVNAVDKAHLIHRALLELEQDWLVRKSHPLFPPGSFTVHAGVIVGGPRRGLIPFELADNATLEVIVWHPPDEPHEQVKAEIERHVAGTAALDSWLRDHPPAVEWKHRWAASAIPAGHPLTVAVAGAHEAATGRAATIQAFPAVSDTTYLADAGVPALVHGPGDIALAHAPDEHVVIDEVIAAARTYALLAADWCGT